MPVLRIEKNKNYTTMSNYHLRDNRLSLKAKGLLSEFLSLPENWDYNLLGLTKINKESKSAIGTAISELEKWGYLTRKQTTDEAGRFGKNEWIIRERPSLYPPSPDFVPPENMPTNDTAADNVPQINTDQRNTEKENTDQSNIDSFLPEGSEMKEEMEQYRAVIQKNISYPSLLQEYPYQQEQLAEILELLTETVCTTRKTIRVAGNDFPAEIVKARLLKLNAEHIRFVLGCMSRNTTKIRNIKQYLLTALYNAPTTIDNYYAAMVSHDLARKENIC